MTHVSGVTGPGKVLPTGSELIEVVLVCYRSSDHVRELFATWPDELPVIVVDNSVGTDGLRALVAQRANTRYLDGGGQGFARAANLGAFAADRPVVVFVNPDSRPDISALSALAAGLTDDPAALSHAATACDETGLPEVGVGGWTPTPQRALVHATGLHKIFPTAGLFAHPPIGQSLPVDWTTGACMAVRTEQFRAIGGFDDMFYVYAEDVALGDAARELGLRQVLRADVRVRHGAGNSGAPSKEMLRLRGASYANYLRSYRPGPAGVAVRAIMVAGHVARAAAACVRGQRSTAEGWWAFVVGLISRRAQVGGVEVARPRYAETVGNGRKRGSR